MYYLVQNAFDYQQLDFLNQVQYVHDKINGKNLWNKIKKRVSIQEFTLYITSQLLNTESTPMQYEHQRMNK